MENQEFYLNCDGIRLHAKLDFPKACPDEAKLDFTEACPDEAKLNFTEACLVEAKLPLMIVVHGFTGDMEELHLTTLSQALNEHGFATLRVEMYGHGMSEGHFHDHHMLLWLSELIRVIDYAAELPFVTNLYLTGHSQGGAATVLAGAIMQDKLKAILPLAPALNLKSGARTGNFLNHNFDPDHMPDEMDFDQPELLSTNHLRVDRYLPFEEATRDFKKPVLLVHSPTDSTVPYECSLWLMERYANAQLVTIENDTHCFDLHLEEVIPPVLKFVEEMEK